MTTFEIICTILSALSLATAVVVLILVLKKRNNAPTALGGGVTESMLQDSLNAIRRDISVDTDTKLSARMEALSMIFNTGNTAVGEALKLGISQLAESTNKQIIQQQNLGTALESRIGLIRTSCEQQIQLMRTELATYMSAVREANAKELKEMRDVVDQKLTETLETRLSASFKQVSDQLESVFKGLGEMKTLATNVGDLQKILSNVKTRGTWGEYSLDSLLSQLLTRGQYEKNVKVNRRSDKICDFAVLLPGAEEGGTVYLPIDSKFPMEDYLRLSDAEAMGADATDLARKALLLSVKKQAASISDKYIQTPYTTDFAIMYLATEGLYAEVLRASGLVEELQQKYRIVICGPTTLAALLNSLQLGFRTLAVQKQSAEVWKLLGTFKNQFRLFNTQLQKIQKKYSETGKQIDAVAGRTEIIEKRLARAETLTDTGAFSTGDDLLPDDLLPDEDKAVLDEVMATDDGGINS